MPGNTAGDLSGPGRLPGNTAGAAAVLAGYRAPLRHAGPAWVGGGGGGARRDSTGAASATGRVSGISGAGIPASGGASSGHPPATSSHAALDGQCGQWSSRAGQAAGISPFRYLAAGAYQRNQGRRIGPRGRAGPVPDLTAGAYQRIQGRRIGPEMTPAAGKIFIPGPHSRAGHIPTSVSGAACPVGRVYA